MIRLAVIDQRGTVLYSVFFDVPKVLKRHREFMISKRNQLAGWKWVQHVDHALAGERLEKINGEWWRIVQG